MNRALFAAASGMAAQQQNLETIAENLSNSDVAGFKAVSLTFQDVGSPSGGTLGTAVNAERITFTQGKLEHSGGPFDIAIEGEGFFAVRDSSGREAFTRDGEFSRSPDGSLRNAQGWRLDGVRIPESALGVNVDARGNVVAKTAKGWQQCGRIRLAEFVSPESLQSSGGTLFFATHESGKPKLIEAGQSNGPQIRFGMLEQSNMTIIEAMMEILAAQRAYEANAKGVQAADEMMRIADNLQRG